jgi:hypothetical protein
MDADSNCNDADADGGSPLTVHVAVAGNAAANFNVPGCILSGATWRTFPPCRSRWAPPFPSRFTCFGNNRVCE